MKGELEPQKCLLTLQPNTINNRIEQATFALHTFAEHKVE